MEDRRFDDTKWGGHYPAALIADAEVREASTSEEFDVAKQKILDDWTGDQAVGLYLYGGPGTSKSVSTARLGIELLEQDNGSSVMWLGNSETGHPDFHKSFTRGSKVGMGGHPSTVLLQSCMQEDRPMVVLDDFGNVTHGDLVEQQRNLEVVTRQASDCGALVVVTSNLEDPFAALDTPDAPENEAAIKFLFDQLDRSGGDTNPFDTSRQREVSSAALRSRMASMFKFIDFGNEDQRPANGFWG